MTYRTGYTPPVADTQTPTAPQVPVQTTRTGGVPSPVPAPAPAPDPAAPPMRSFWGSIGTPGGPTTFSEWIASRANQNAPASWQGPQLLQGNMQPPAAQGQLGLLNRPYTNPWATRNPWNIQ